MDMNLSDTRSRQRRTSYRHHPLEFKRAVVEQSLKADMSAARVAREHGINANQVFTWRKAYREGRLDRTVFLPVSVKPLSVEPMDEAHSLRETVVPSLAPGRLVIERCGTRLIVEGRPDAQVLSQLLAALLG